MRLYTKCLFVMATMFYSFTKVDVSSRKVFRYTNDMYISSYIVVEKSGDKTVGTFYGVEFNRDTNLVYYKSDFKVTSKNSGEIYFKLDSFNYSLNPIIPGKPIPSFLTDQHKIPYFGGIYFWGKLEDDMLVLKRTRDIYDSRFDKMTFFEVK